MDSTLLKETVRSIRSRARRVSDLSPLAACELVKAADAIDSALEKTEQEPRAKAVAAEAEPHDRRGERGNAFNNIWCYRTMPHPLDDDR